MAMEKILIAVWELMEGGDAGALWWWCGCRILLFMALYGPWRSMGGVGNTIHYICRSIVCIVIVGRGGTMQGRDGTWVCLLKGHQLTDKRYLWFSRFIAWPVSVIRRNVYNRNWRVRKTSTICCDKMIGIKSPKEASHNFWSQKTCKINFFYKLARFGFK